MMRFVLYGGDVKNESTIHVPFIGADAPEHPEITMALPTETPAIDELVKMLMLVKFPPDSPAGSHSTGVITVLPVDASATEDNATLAHTGAVPGPS